MARYWIAVASRDHVALGARGGFAQVCHGKSGPLARMREGDGIVYYSPRESFGGGAPCRAFTAIGRVEARAPYAHDMGGGFVPYRRDVAYVAAHAAPIAPLLAELAFVRAAGASWGIVFRRGHFEIPEGDFLRIARAMGASLEERAA
jgi:hypothetical protein